MNAATLSSFIWEQGLNTAPNVEKEIIRTAKIYKQGLGNCQLCIQEKFQINAQVGNPKILNKKDGNRPDLQL